jgi:hypothetical protein
MLTDEELTTRLSAAFHESAPELTYAGPVPHVRRGHAGLVTTSALAAAAALALTPAALQRGDEQPPGPPGGVPSAGPGTHRSAATGHGRVYRLNLGGLRLSFASDDGDPGDIYYYVGPHVTVPPDAEKLDLGLPYDVWYDDHAASGQPQIYVGHRTCPDTVDGCNGGPPQLEVFGILAPGWTRDQLIYLIEHPLYDQTTTKGGKRYLERPRLNHSS